MADRTLTINHADGGSETYTLKTEDVLGVRSMSVDGETVTIDRTAPDLVRTIIADGQTITIDTTREGVRTLTVDGTEITIDRTEESNLDSFLQQFTGASVAYSLRDLASNSGNTTVVRVRRSSDNTEADFKAKEVSDGTLVTWVGAGNDGFVPTWYDQSGNGNDAVQLTAGSQPKIVDAGVLVSGGIDFDGVNDWLQYNALAFSDGLISAFAVRTLDAPTTINSSIFDCANDLTFGISNGFRLDNILSNARFGTNSAFSKAANTSTSTQLQSGIKTSTTRFGYLDGNQIDSDAVAGNVTFTSVTQHRIGGNPNLSDQSSATNFCDGRINEIIVYNSDQSANRVGIETNINNQYDIY